MLNLVILGFWALSGLNAAPLRDDVVAPPRGLVPNDQLIPPMRIPAYDLRRQGTEPSRRFLVDLNTGLVKEHISEMDRRVGHGFESYSVGSFGQGFQNSQHAPVDRKTENIIQVVGDTETNVILYSAGPVEVPAQMIETGWVRETGNLPHSVPVEERRQGTEPSRRFLVDQNTGLVMEHISEMDRRVEKVSVPPIMDLFRQGTQNSHATLVDPRTGRIIQEVGEMERNFMLKPQAMQNEGSEVVAEVHSVPVEERRQGTEPSRRFLVDQNTGLVMEHISEMDRRVGDSETDVILYSAGPVEVPAQMIETGWVRETGNLPHSVPVEERRQGTEPSRRFLVDQNTGLVMEHISEMDRRVEKVSVPPIMDLFRQGTQNSHATLVDPRTGRIIQEVGEMERNFMLKPQAMQNEGSEVVAEVHSVPVEERRQGTEPSRRFLVDQNTGLVMEHISEMERRVGDSETDVILYSAGPVEVPAQMIETGWVRETGNLPHSVPVEERRQGTEPSRRFLVDQNTGLVMEHISEMDRRVEKVSVPPIMDLFRQGTQNSHATLVDPRTGRIIQEVGEMERNFMLKPQVVSRLQDQLDTECVGEVINGLCYHFNPTPMTFSKAEASCIQLSPLGNLASITNSDLHSRLVAMVTKTSKSPVLTWLGGVGKDQKYEWTDGSAWDYTDWMPGHPNTLRDKPVCLEMFRVEESWWTSVDCQLKRASICSYPVEA